MHIEYNKLVKLVNATLAYIKKKKFSLNLSAQSRAPNSHADILLNIVLHGIAQNHPFTRYEGYLSHQILSIITCNPLENELGCCCCPPSAIHYQLGCLPLASRTHWRVGVQFLDSVQSAIQTLPSSGHIARRVPTPQCLVPTLPLRVNRHCSVFILCGMMWKPLFTCPINAPV